MTELRVRAQRRAGEMLRQAAEQGMRHDGRNLGSHNATPALTLAYPSDYSGFLPRDDPPRATPAKFLEEFNGIFDAEGWSPDHPMRVEERDGQFVVIDGWKRFEAARDLGIAIPYVIESAAAHPPTLSEIGLTKSESSRYQQLAAMPAEHFETAVATAKATAGEVTTAFMLRAAAPSAAGSPRLQKSAAFRGCARRGDRLVSAGRLQSFTRPGVEASTAPPDGDGGIESFRPADPEPSRSLTRAENAES